MVASSSIALIAFFVEFCTRSLAQYGFLLQKLAHRDLEKDLHEKKKENEENGPSEAGVSELDKV